MAAPPTPSHVLRWNMITLPLKSHPVARDASTGAVNLHRECIEAGNMEARLGNASQCKACLKILNKDEIVKGFPEGDGYTLVAETELTALAAESTKAMDLLGFCPFEDVDPKWLGLANFLGPVDMTIYRPYMLLYQTMLDLDLAALVTYNGRGRDKVGVIRPGKESLVLFDAFFPAEVRTYADQFKVPLNKIAFSAEETRLATQLINTSRIEFEPVILDQRDRYLDRVEELKVARREGKAIPNFERAIAQPAGMDLLAALKASLGAVPATPSKPPAKMEAKPAAEPKKAAAKKRRSA
jgi:DNA end-binding protein Ku